MKEYELRGQKKLCWLFHIKNNTARNHDITSQKMYDRQKNEFWVLYAQMHVKHSRNCMFQKLWRCRTNKRSLEKNKFYRRSGFDPGRDIEEWRELNMNWL